MNIQGYIESGILEQYCLDLLNADEREAVIKNCAIFPEIKRELNIIEQTIEKLAATQALTPNEGVKQRILNSLGFAEKLDLNNLPVVDAYADYKSWFSAVEHLIPAQPFDDFFMEVLRQDEQAAQMLVVTKLDVPEETHDNWIESFFILQGQCTCKVGDEVFTLNAGDFLEIPLHTDHDIKINTPHVVAILQRIPV